MLPEWVEPGIITRPNCHYKRGTHTNVEDVFFPCTTKDSIKDSIIGKMCKGQLFSVLRFYLSLRDIH